MSSLRSRLSSLFGETFASLGLDSSYGEVVESNRVDLGQFQCNGALASAKAARCAPRQIAEKVVAVLSTTHPDLTLSIAGPGFVNISVSGRFLADHVAGIAADPRLGCARTASPENVVVDFGGPNVAKPMHVGHLRSSIIGDALQRLFRFHGDNVTSDIHLGDWGTQMGMLITEMRRRAPDLPYFNESCSGPWPQDPPVTIHDLDEMYPAASKRCKENDADMAQALEATVKLQQGNPGYRALWSHFVRVSERALAEDFGALGVSFDLWQGESYYHDLIPAMLDCLKTEGHAVVSEGALVVPVEIDGVAEIPPLILVKKDGGYLYGTTDLATLRDRVGRGGADRILYVVDKRQSLHFTQVFSAARRSGIAGPGVVLEHVQFGTVNGPDGRPFKTRAGGVMKLRDLITEVNEKAFACMDEAGIARDYPVEERSEIASMVGLAALKFADLMNYRASDYVFDLDRFTKFEGKTGPYLLYSAVRIKSILRKASEQGLDNQNEIVSLRGEEVPLMLALCRLPDVLDAVRREYAPHLLCEFLFSLAQEFNRFYQECHILRETDASLRSTWLGLCRLVLTEFERSLELLGIAVPERM